MKLVRIAGSGAREDEVIAGLGSIRHTLVSVGILTLEQLRAYPQGKLAALTMRRDQRRRIADLLAREL